MAIPLSSTVTAWKESSARSDVLVTLFDIPIDDATTLRLVQGDPTGTGSVTYDGNVYTAAAVVVGDEEQSVEGELPSLTVGVSNIDGVAGGYIETHDLDGQRVTITNTLLSELDPAGAIVRSYRIQDTSYDRRQATFVLSNSNLFRRIVPWRAFVRHKCQWDYENRFQDGNGCGYPSDRFGPSTRQNVIVGRTTDGEQERQFGWFTLNALKAKFWDVDRSAPDFLLLESDSNDIFWNTAIRSGPFFYKKLTADFDVFTEVQIFSSRVGAVMGILCQEAAGGLDSWIFVARGENAEGGIQIETHSALNGVDETSATVANDSDTFLRMKRVGNNFSTYHATARDTNWQLIDTRSVALDADVRIGLVIAAPSSEQGTVSAGFREFQFRAGGLPTCDRTLDDADGCRVHKNIQRMLAFRGIPRA